MRLIDADAMKTDYGMKDNCKDCEKELRGYVRQCEYDAVYTKMDFCGWIDSMPTIEPEPKWIPTKERLPKIGRVVIISVSGVYTAEGYLKDNGDWHVFRFDRPQENKFVDAWMPLPEQYKENK